MTCLGNLLIISKDPLSPVWGWISWAPPLLAQSVCHPTDAPGSSTPVHTLGYPIFTISL